MYSVGLPVVFAQLILRASLLNTLVVLVGSVLILILYLSYSDRHIEHNVPSLPGFFLFNVFPFFRQRFDFIRRGFEAVPDHTLFRFRLLRVST